MSSSEVRIFQGDGQRKSHHEKRKKNSDFVEILDIVKIGQSATMVNNECEMLDFKA